MIIEADECERPLIIDMLSKDICQNPYIYIDIISLGISNGISCTWKIVHDEDIAGIIYKYYNSLQLFVTSEISPADYRDIAKFIKHGEYEMVTGRADIITNLQNILGDLYNSYFGSVMAFCQTTIESVECDVTVASLNDLHDAAELVCSDKNIGGHYSVEQLATQFRDRMLHHDCFNLVCKAGDDVVCHAATYASVDKYAVIGGVITKQDYRRKGLARATILRLVNILQSQNKLPIIFCYSPSLLDWYKQIGFELKTNCGKLEIIR